ncbi:hypothetical protein BDN67DRAFT_975651 [Paxillus ammoniavirescens]|nr:hypothetical protein BDN67DRAFT_975651 [Paxillus ammoniavirescens]
MVLQSVNLRLQTQVEQLRRQLDHSKWEARAERDRLDKDIEELPYRGQESGQPQELQLPTGSLITQVGPSSHAESERWNSHTGASTHQDGPPTLPNVVLEGRPSSSMQFDSDSLQPAMKDKRTENALSRLTGEATQSQSTVHPPHHHDSQRDVTVAPAASPATDELNLQRVVLQLQGQVEENRRSFDDPKRKAEEKEGLENVYRGQESDEPHPRMQTGAQYPITTHFTQAVINDADHPSLKSGSPSAVAGAFSLSDHGRSTPHADPSTSSNAPPETRPSSSAQVNSDSVQAKERVNEQTRETALSDPMSHVTPSSQTAVRPHHNDARRYDIRSGSTAADEADLQRVVLQLQEQNEQLRRQLDDTTRKAEAERYMLEKEVAELRSRGHESHKSQAHHIPPGSPGPSSPRAEPLGSNSNAGVSTHLAGPSTFSTLPRPGRRSSSAPSDSDLIEDEKGTSQ